MSAPTVPAELTPLVNFAPSLRLALIVLLLALLPLAWLAWKQRGSARAATGSRRRTATLAALTALTMFLTFDLIVFGAFTRLTDSGLGCPDWPGCYGQATPLGARAQIAAEQAQLPDGPVTWGKAWIEMIHRYLAMTVGFLILLTSVLAWRMHRRGAGGGAGTASGGESAALPFSPWWPTLTLVWVVIQGLFGKYTVTWKLYPAVVTLHLLGGIVLLMLLAVQHVALAESPARRPLGLSRGVQRLALVGSALLLVQIALGGWVSTNYAVLACSGFPLCNGEWLPAMDLRAGFTLLRELGRTGQGEYLPLDALVAIHWVHRVAAVIVVAALLALAWRLWRDGRGDGQSNEPRDGAALRCFASGLTLLVLLQVASGLSNVVLGWPIVAALGHSAGSAALMLLLTLLLAHCRAQASRVSAMPATAPTQPSAATNASALPAREGARLIASDPSTM